MKKSKEINALATLVMFSLWKERNSRTFEKTPSVVSRIMAEWKLWILAWKQKKQSRQRIEDGETLSMSVRWWWIVVELRLMYPLKFLYCFFHSYIGSLGLPVIMHCYVNKVLEGLLYFQSLTCVSEAKFKKARLGAARWQNASLCPYALGKAQGAPGRGAFSLCA